MEGRKFLNQLDVLTHPHIGRRRTEVLDTVTVITVPDQSLTIREIVDRYVRNIPIDMISHDIYYDGDSEVLTHDDVDITASPDFDLADYSAYLEALKQRRAQASVQQRAAAEQNAADAAAKENEAKRNASESAASKAADSAAQ